MRKKDSSWLFLIVIAVILAVGMGWIQLPFSAFATDDFTIKSITATQVISPDTDLKGVWWTVVARAGGGQKIVGSFTPNEWKSFTGIETEYPLMIEMNNLNEYVTYPIINEKYPIYRYDFKMTDCSALQVPNCPLTFNGNPLAIYGRTSYNCSFFEQRNYCWYKSQPYLKGYLGSSGTKFGANITLTAHGEKITKIISTDDTIVSFVGSQGEVAIVEWDGSMITGYNPPEGTRYVAYTPRGGGTWKIGTLTEFGDYQASQRVIDQYILTYHGGADILGILTGDVEKIINEHNKIVDNIVTKSVPIMNNDSVSIPYIVSGSDVKGDLNYRITVPQFIFKVRADWIGVKITAGKPVIINATCPDFASGSEGSFILNVYNSGDYSGTFISRIEGCDPITMKYAPDETTIGSKQTKTIILPLKAGNVNEQLSKTCHAVVQDKNKPSVSASVDSTCTLTLAQTCIPGTESTSIELNGNTCIYKCEADGMTKTKIKCCETGVTYDAVSGTYDCAGPPVPLTCEMIPWTRFEEKINCYYDKYGILLILGIILAIIIVIKFASKGRGGYAGTPVIIQR